MHSLRATYIYTFVVSLLVVLAAALPVPLQAKQFTVTLDAGHGGKDYGAIGKTTNEKTITLAVVRRLGELIETNLPDVNVVYTRKSDHFVELAERAAIANKAGSDLFISVHINSVDKRNRNRANITGCQVYTLGLHKTAENLAVAKRENAVMELEADHTEKYAGFDPNSLESDIVFELFQNKRLDQSIEFADAVHTQLVDIASREPKGVRQAGFWVLWATSMPSVLVELDFICNPTAEKYLASDSGQEEMVTALYNAFCAYYNTYAPQITGRQIPVAQAIVPQGKGSGEASAGAPRIHATVQEAPAAEKPAETPAEGAPESIGGIPMIDSSDDTPRYYVQILASSDPIKKGSPELKRLEGVEYYRDGGMYKYAVGVARDVPEAKKLMKKVKKSFPGCFIVKMVRGQRVDFIKP